MQRLIAASVLAVVAGCASQPGGGTGPSSSGSSGGGGTCGDWRTQPDAGPCTTDSDCPASYYCDYVLGFCGYAGGPLRWDGGPYFLATFDAGVCRLACSSPDAGACQIGEDCGAEVCSGNPEPIGPTGDFCNLLQPCDAGRCITPSYPSPPACPPGCQAMAPAHETVYGCVCPGNTCVLPGGDGG